MSMFNVQSDLSLNHLKLTLVIKPHEFKINYGKEHHVPFVTENSKLKYYYDKIQLNL